MPTPCTTAWRRRARKSRTRSKTRRSRRAWSCAARGSTGSSSALRRASCCSRTTGTSSSTGSRSSTYLRAGSTASKVKTLDVNGWIEPGTSRNVDLDEVARQATARVYVHADPEGYGNIQLALLEAKIFDNPDSPYADAVSSAKAILRGIDNNDIPSIRAMAQRMANGLQQSAPAVAAVDVIAPRPEPAVAAPAPEIAAELQSIEDLLTGTEAERRQGLDKLHQLLCRLRR